jgi:4'-phosphopantetheinyl transferase
MNNEEQRAKDIGVLLPGDVHLWLTFYDEIEDQGLLRTYEELLKDAEREQWRRFYFARDRRRYLVTRALVRTVLSRYAAISPSNWIFETNAYGRPDIANPEIRGTGLSFNISHTQSMIVLGVTKCAAVGVDVENVRSRQVSIGIADRFFAPSEVTALAAVSSIQRQERFFEYWTFKEAYIKARGMGLSLPLDKFSFSYANDQAVEIAIDPLLADDAGRWRFWQFRPRPEYMVAVCAERIGSSAPEVIIRQVVPWRADSSLLLPVSRTSNATAGGWKGVGA